MVVDKNKLLKESKTFCMFPWMHIYSNPDGTTWPCCNTEPEVINESLENKTLEEIFVSEKWNQLRLDMLEGKENPACRKCYAVEKAGGASYRSYANKDFGNNIDLVDNTLQDGSLESVQFKYIDIRFSNQCNQACATCGPEFSTYWQKLLIDNDRFFDKFKKFYRLSNHSKENIFEQLKPHFPTAQEIYFAGGEPLIMDEHYQILNHLIDIKANDTVKLRYNSNCSNFYYKKSSVINLWNKFKYVKLGASVDAVEDVAELIRFGTNFKTLSSNLKEALTCENLILQYDTVVSVLNIDHLPYMYDYLLENDLVNKQTWFTLNLAFTPLPFSLTSLIPKYKEKYSKKILDYADSLENRKVKNIGTSAKEFLINQLRAIPNFMYGSDTWEKDEKWYGLHALVGWTIRDHQAFENLIPDVYDMAFNIANRYDRNGNRIS